LAEDEAPVSGQLASANPLELKTAILFGVLFVFFTLLTNFILRTYGGKGINLMAMVVGVTDIDPFILSLFQGTLNLDTSSITIATLIAVNSNNLLKLGYSMFLSAPVLRKDMLIGFGSVILTGTAQIIWKIAEHG
jgi:uncharacterized membrane protein (DUF4010 family)